MPPAVCRHNSYWYWLPAGRSGETAIAVNVDEGSLRASCAEVTLWRQPYAIDYEGQARIYICKHRTQPLLGKAATGGFGAGPTPHSWSSRWQAAPKVILYTCTLRLGRRRRSSLLPDQS